MRPWHLLVASVSLIVAIVSVGHGITASNAAWREEVSTKVAKVEQRVCAVEKDVDAHQGLPERVGRMEQGILAFKGLLESIDARLARFEDRYFSGGEDR